MDTEQLFHDLYFSGTEQDVDDIISKCSTNDISWKPYGDSESNFGVIENQQASPIPALVEKITNSIDAILMRRCYEEGIDPKSDSAPKSIEDAVKLFFPDSASWDLSLKRKLQSEDIQILADGPRRDTSLIIYDNGEGQHPDDFPSTFLSLLRGNKNEIHFVQGKYNMGGAGAIVFCGKKRYQLIASKRYDNSGDFGFTIVRKHPLSEREGHVKKNTWYEYLTINSKIPCFPIKELDLGLRKRSFTTGTILKLYSYDLPTGISDISRDLNQSMNEYLFEPALPLFIIEKKERYPDTYGRERDLFGLKRRMESDGDKYLKEKFSELKKDSSIGTFKCTIYLFKPRLDGRTAKDSKLKIRTEFFKNNMSVIFSLNGQVHGHYTSEFISRSLKFPLLKHHLLIHVDCTNLKLEFRNELFMASRDRLKNGEESSRLRNLLTGILTKGRLKEIHHEWQSSLTSHAESSDELLKDFSKNLPLNSDLMRLLNHAFNLDQKKGDAKKKSRKNPTKNKTPNEIPFNPKRFPSSFTIDVKSSNNDSIPLTKLPVNGEKTILFSTDVEDQYFDRVEEPGSLKIAVLSLGQNTSSGGDRSGELKDVGGIFDITHSSPTKGKIRVNINPTSKVNVGDSVKMKATLSSPDGNLEQIFIVQISEKQKKNTTPLEKKSESENIGLPKLVKVYKDKVNNKKTWDDLESDGISFGYKTVMHPLLDGDKLGTVFINMNSRVLQSYKSKSKVNNEEQITIADARYISTVYFHTIFLYMITKNRNYTIQKPSKNSNVPDDVEITAYLIDVFDSFYSEFLLNFEMSTLMENLSD